MIKYLGSKRRLVPVLGALQQATGAMTALDLFTGTTRVAQDWKRRGAFVWAVDLARYAEVLGQCYIETDADTVDMGELDDILSHLQHLPGEDGYVTATFSRAARYFQVHNGRRIDAIRVRDRPALRRPPPGARPAHVAAGGGRPGRLHHRPADGLPEAVVPPVPSGPGPPPARVLLPGAGRCVRGDATSVVATLPEVDLAYFDPPYNQHRYFTNYHVWETLVAWDAPEHYGVACKRVDARDPSTKSVFNDRRRAPAALAQLIADVRARVVVVSTSSEGWATMEDVVDMAACRGRVEVLAFDSKRYVGALIGIHNPQGEKVGRVSHTRNVEYLIVAGEDDLVGRLALVYESGQLSPTGN